ncbi:toxin-antitoxin system HicB family antitoxin [Bremerella sp. T1]|uniref:toxin-antitoxin system HicB family antitoxin n=1 Tax=Bremerella sp. TYQ1 TaxID=3119568 RepID=UPI001CCB1D67|nr:toxin-antitoxin system HicB family antitoxin [Bremerella volcania]UBM36096.1 toxin-antitoxin system HicB family antitoxin [Bremerella volcania]
MSQYNQGTNPYPQSQPAPRPVYPNTTFPPQQHSQPQYHAPQPTATEGAYATSRPTFTGTPQAPVQPAAPAGPALNVAPTATFEEKKAECVRIARDFFRGVPDWVTYFREILGVEGVVHRLFPQPEEFTKFEQSEEYSEIQLMIVKLRERTNVQNESKEPTRVITVRLPKSLHESLRVEAHSRRTSMNKLCISKLLQVIDDSMIPND